MPYLEPSGSRRVYRVPCAFGKKHRSAIKTRAGIHECGLFQLRPLTITIQSIRELLNIMNGRPPSSWCVVELPLLDADNSIEESQ